MSHTCSILYHTACSMVQKPTLSDVDSLKALPFMKDGTIQNLKAKLPAYMAKAEDVLQ